MKVTLALVLAGIGAAAPTATGSFDHVRETLPPRSTGFSAGSHGSWDLFEPERGSRSAPRPMFTRLPLVTPDAVFPGVGPCHINDIQPRAEPTNTSESPENEVDVPLDAHLEEFEDSPFYSRIAQDEDAPYPYERIFADQNATAIHQPIETHVLDEYDANECAIHCNEHRACRAFGVFVERQPSCTDCVDPETHEMNMCELYNTPLERRVITDGNREESVQGEAFTRAVRASNGYNKVVPRVTVTSYRTVTATVRESRPVSASSVYRTRTVTTSAQRATTTVWSTVTSDRDKTVTVTAPASVRTEISTHTIPNIPSTRTVTLKQTTHDIPPDRTVTLTQTAHRDPNITTITVTETHRLPDSTITHLTTRTITSLDPTTLTTTHRETVVLSPTPSVQPTTLTETRTSTETTLHIVTHTTVRMPTFTPYEPDEESSSEDEGEGVSTRIAR